MTDQYTRPSSPDMDKILGQKIPVLDHGFIRPVDYMGNDAAVVQAARVSYGLGTKTPTKDEGLIRYMKSHWHNTPFEMCEIKLHVKLPVFVARQWIRHRTANVNEYSARYSILDNEFYMPELSAVRKQSQTNKQGRGEPFSPVEAVAIRDTMFTSAQTAYATYDTLTDEKVDLARELARNTLPVNIYTQWYWKVDAHNLMNFMRLRVDPHAQYEIREYAKVVLRLFETWMPAAAQAFKDYDMLATSLSAQASAVVQYFVASDPTEDEARHAHAQWARMSSREKAEFVAKWGRGL